MTKITIDWKHALYWACKGGNLELINILIDKVENNYISGSLYNVCIRGDINIAKFLINKGAYVIFVDVNNDIEYISFINVIEHINELSIIDLLISKKLVKLNTKYIEYIKYATLVASISRYANDITVNRDVGYIINDFIGKNDSK